MEAYTNTYLRYRTVSYLPYLRYWTNLGTVSLVPKYSALNYIILENF